MNQSNTEQSPAPITPIVIQCLMPEAMTKLSQQADEMCWELQTMRKTLPSLKSHTDLTAVLNSLTEIQKALTELISLSEQAGSQNERRTCKWLKWLPDFDLWLVVKWVMLVLVLTAAVLAMVYGTATVVSNIRSLFP